MCLKELRNKMVLCVSVSKEAAVSQVTGEGRESLL